MMIMPAQCERASKKVHSIDSLDVRGVAQSQDSVFHVVEGIARMGLAEEELPKLFHVVWFVALACCRSNEHHEVLSDQE